MATPNDLTTLLAAKNYLGIMNSNSDSILAQLITACSRDFLFLTRWSTFAPTTVTRYLDGSNTDTIMLTDRPIQSISLLQIGTRTILPSPSWPTYGYVFDSWGRISLRGGIFPRQRQNIKITYSYGFATQAVTNEIQIPLTSNNFTVTPNYGPFYSDQGVTYLIGGTSLTAVPGAPTKGGQYSLIPTTGQYLFHPSDGTLQLFLNYTYLAVPENISQCVNEMVGYKYGIRGSITVKSETIVGAQQIVRLTDYPDYICRTLIRFERRYGGTANASAGGGW